MRANIAINPDPTKLQRAKMALVPKKKFTLEDYEDHGNGYFIGYFDQFGEFYEAPVSKEAICIHIIEDYNDTRDTFYGGVHEQIVDTRTPMELLEEDPAEYITSFLNK